MFGNIEVYASGSNTYHDLNAKYRIVDLARFLKSLSREQMVKDRDDIILNLLYYTTDNRRQMVEVLEGYIGELE